MVRGIELFFALFNNLALFIALVTVYRFLLGRFRQTNRYKKQLVLGLSFGAFAIGCMYAKIPVFHGVIVDQRNAIVTLSGAFGGPLSAVISAALAGAFRIYLGGKGALGGFIGVNLAALAGIGLYRFQKRTDSVRDTAIGALAATILILPGFLFIGDFRVGWQLMKAMALPYGSAIFLGIFLGSLLMNREESRYQIEVSFRESEKKYRELVEGTMDLITHTDKHGKLTFVNHIAEKILGCSSQDCIGQSAFHFVHPDDKQDTVEWFERCIKGGIKQSAFENRQINSKTGQLHTVLWSSAFHYSDAGELIGVGNIARDITEQKKAVESLRASEARYRTLFEYVPDGILITDARGSIIDANPMMCRMLDYRHDELITLRVSDIVHPGDIPDVDPTIKQAVSNVEDFRVWHYRRKNESVFVAEVLVTTMPDNKVLAMVRDITQRRELEARLLQAQKIESLGQLAGGIAHDFNNLLMPIMGIVELIMRKLGPDNHVYTDLERVLSAAERAAGLTQQILAFSRKQVLEMRTLDLNEVTTAFSAMIHRLIGEDIEFRTILDPALHRINADKGQIEQILLNLAINAREAMPRGGVLTIETANVYLDKEYIQEHADDQTPGHYAMLAVSDTGSGMDAETQKHIFEPFYTTKGPGKGTGLGLSTVFGIVKQHRGAIWVYSEPGQGTTFKIYLPQMEGETLTEDVAEDGPTSLFGDETILLVEDEVMVRSIVYETLSVYGYKVIEASGPTEGLGLLASSKETIHLLLTDVIMPEMNGRELYEKLVAAQPGLKVLFMSGYTDEVIVHRGILDEGLNFIQKPFTIRKLAEKVRRALG